MQTNQPQIATTPPPAGKPPSLTIVGPDGQTRVITVPVTEEDMSALLARRASLSDQLTSVTSNRSGNLLTLRNVTSALVADAERLTSVGVTVKLDAAAA